MSEFNFSKIAELADLIVEFGSKCAEIINKNGLTEEDIEEVKKRIKENPEEYFPSLKK